ncbi:hypothetical protein OIU76_010897 [Salix suchowensis]|nr:hypothetical protein OIU76_010897 [Salix suchowensis]
MFLLQLRSLISEIVSKEKEFPHYLTISFPETTRNLANLGGLRARLSLKQAISDCQNDDEDCRRSLSFFSLLPLLFSASSLSLLKRC